MRLRRKCLSNYLSLIVDADIARSSGMREHPVSRNSRESLEFIIENDLKIAMCRELLNEWNKHKSIFARTWLSSMYAKKKVVPIKPLSKAIEKINNSEITSKEHSIASKDAHLIDAALHTDKVILSNDDNARKVFCKISEKHKDLQSIRWFNVVNHSAEACDCLLKKQNLTPQKFFLGI